MAKFKAGDRVYYRDDVNDTGTIVEPAGHDRWWVMWDQSHVRLSAYEHNLNLIKEKNMKFKVGDRVLEKSPQGEQTIGVITRLVDDWKFAPKDAWWVMWETGPDAGEERWTFEKYLELIDDSDETVKMKFKVGNRVRMLMCNWHGIIRDRKDDYWLVHWDQGVSEWVNERELELVQQSDAQITVNQPAESKVTVDTYTVAEFKKLLNKMDDNLILEMVNLRILFNRVPK